MLIEVATNAKTACVKQVIMLEVHNFKRSYESMLFVNDDVFW